jgi:hypothetical protein
MRPLPTKTGLPRLDRASWEKGFSDGFRGLVWWPGAGIEPLSYSTGYTEAQAERDPDHRQSSSPFAVPTSSPAMASGPLTDDERRRLLALLAESDDGCTADLLVALGFALEVIASAVRAGLATMQAEPMPAAGREIEISCARITDAGRRALAERQG